MKIFITGVTGSLGTSVTRKLLARDYEVVGFSRDELKQQKFDKHPKLTLYLGDVRDENRVIEASRDAQLIFNFAALKHVDKLEECPEEAFKTNLLGMENVLHAQRMNAVFRVVLSSTDKAAYPINAYGISKAAAEKLVLRNKNNIVCRYGNVLASRGSVVEKIVESLVRERKVYLTDPNMSRFWITIDEAANFVIQSGLNAKEGGLKIPEMKAAPLSLLAQVIAEILGVKSYEIIHTGIRPGEKLQECLRTEAEGGEVFSHRASQYTEHELFEILKPIVEAIA